MRHRAAILALLTVSAVLFTSLSSASAAGKVNFLKTYNTVNNTFNAFGHIADTHNSYVKHHHSTCSAAQKQKWSAKAQNDVNTVLAVDKKLTGVKGQARKKHVYHDLMQTVRDLKHWSTTQVVPQLRKCKAMSDTNFTVQQDILNDKTDLGLPTY
jgi:hypothetical protein